MHLLAVVFRGKLRVVLKLPQSDPLLNAPCALFLTVNQGNCDFSPVVSPAVVTGYMCKYQFKAEKYSKSMERTLHDISKAVMNDLGGMPSVITKFVNSTFADHDWSHQEIAHVLMGCRSVTSTREFVRINLATKCRVLGVTAHTF